MHSSRMRTVRSSSHVLRGVSASLHAEIPPDMDLETPLGEGLEIPWV